MNADDDRRVFLSLYLTSERQTGVNNSRVNVILRRGFNLIKS